MTWISSPENKPSPLSTIAGNAAGTMRKRGRPARKAASSPVEESPSTIDTSATDTARNADLTSSPSFSISAASTPLRSSSYTIWTENLLGFIENGSRPITNEEWQQLPDSIRHRLVVLADSQGQTPEDLIYAIVEYYVGEDAELVQGTVQEALEFYLENEIL